MVSISLRRGSLSLSLDISRSSSVYTSHSYTSLEPLEPLVPKFHSRRYSSTTSFIKPGPRPVVRNLNKKHFQAARGQQRRRMASNGTQAVAIEQKKSYGIGGAGNIRRPSEIIYPPRVNPDGTRRSSVWSTMSVSPGSSPDSKRATFMNLFARKGSVSEGTNAYTEVDGRGVKFNEVEMGGKSTTESG